MYAAKCGTILSLKKKCSYRWKSHLCSHTAICLFIWQTLFSLRCPWAALPGRGSCVHFPPTPPGQSGMWPGHSLVLKTRSSADMLSPHSREPDFSQVASLFTSCFAPNSSPLQGRPPACALPGPRGSEPFLAGPGSWAETSRDGGDDQGTVYVQPGG